MDGTNIAKEIFNSKLPVRVYHGNTSTYIQVFRASYLLIELKTFIPENSKFPYFTDKLTNLPLKWHLPISVLHDISTLICQNQNNDVNTNPSKSNSLTTNNPPNDNSSPLNTSPIWEIVLHNPEIESLFPENLLKFNTWQDATKYQTFMMAKAADHIRNRGDIISKLTPQQKESRWTALESRNFENYWLETENLLSSATKKWPLMIHKNIGNSLFSKMTVNTQFEMECKQSEKVFYANTGADSEKCFLNGVRLSAEQVIDEIELVSRSCVMPDNCLHLVIKS